MRIRKRVVVLAVVLAVAVKAEASPAPAGPAVAGPVRAEGGGRLPAAETFAGPACASCHKDGSRAAAHDHPCLLREAGR